MPQAYFDRKALAVSDGTCVRCRKAAPIEGKLQCVACREISLRAVAASQRKVREECIAGYGGRCVCCGEINLAFLTIDHVNNDGAEERRAGLRAHVLYRKVVREDFPARYQVLCYNCNCVKGAYGRCPHEDARKTN